MILGRVAWVVTLTYSAALVAHAVRNGCYWGDDLSTFRRSLEQPFREVALLPLGSQIVPLHRAVTVALYRLLPFVWPAAVLLLASFHVLAIGLLWRVLQLLRPSRMNAFLVAVYATHVFAGVQLTWFSSGLTRGPYVVLCLVAILSYLRLSRQPGRLLPAIAVFAMVLAFGFYTKAILIPLYCLGVDFAARGRSAFTDRRMWRPFAALVLADLAVFLVVRSQQDWVARTLNLDWAHQLQFLQTALSVVAHGFVGVVQEYGHYSPRAWALAVFPALAVVSVVRAPASWRAWAVGFGLVVVNLAVVGLSNRTIMFKDFMPFELRHHYELCFLVVLLGGVALGALVEREPAVRSVGWRPRAFVAATALGLLLVGFSVHSYRTFVDVAPRVSSPRSCQFLGNLRADFGRLPRNPSPTFVDAQLPMFLFGLDLTFLRYSQLFRVLDFDARFSKRGEFRVDEAGRVVRVRRRLPR